MAAVEQPHIGWLVPGETVCIGAGPVRLRYSREEARALMFDLRNLLRPGGHVHECGCAPPLPAAEAGDGEDDAVPAVVAGLDEAQKRAAIRARFGSWE